MDASQGHRDLLGDLTLHMPYVMFSARLYLNRLVLCSVTVQNLKELEHALCVYGAQKYVHSYQRAELEYRSSGQMICELHFALR